MISLIFWFILSYYYFLTILSCFLFHLLLCLYLVLLSSWVFSYSQALPFFPVSYSIAFSFSFLLLLVIFFPFCPSPYMYCSFYLQYSLDYSYLSSYNLSLLHLLSFYDRYLIFALCFLLILLSSSLLQYSDYFDSLLSCFFLLPLIYFSCCLSLAYFYSCCSFVSSCRLHLSPLFIFASFFREFIAWFPIYPYFPPFLLLFPFPLFFSVIVLFLIFWFFSYCFLFLLPCTLHLPFCSVVLPGWSLPSLLLL